MFAADEDITSSDIRETQQIVMPGYQAIVEHPEKGIKPILGAVIIAVLLIRWTLK